MPGSFSGPWTIPERARWQGATGRKATLRTPHALSSAPAPCHGAGASKHPFSKRCCLPESEALSRLDSGLWTLVHAPAVSGGMGLPVRASAHLAVCFEQDRKSTRLNSSHSQISYAVFCLKKKKKNNTVMTARNNSTSQSAKGGKHKVARYEEDYRVALHVLSSCDCLPSPVTRNQCHTHRD